MAAKSFNDTNGNGITRQLGLDSGDTFSTTVKGINYNAGGTGSIINQGLVYYEPTGAAARKITATGGFGFSVITTNTARDTTTATYRTIMVKIWVTQYKVVNTAGIQFVSGNTVNDQNVWIMASSQSATRPGLAYPPLGGWVIKPVDQTHRAWALAPAGSPTETAVNVFGAWGDLSSTGGNDVNLGLDAIDFVETGFHVTGGTGTDPVVIFEDFVDQDQGNSSTNFGFLGAWQKIDDNVFQFFCGAIFGRTYAGTATATEAEDSFVTLICPGGYARAGTNYLEWDISIASQSYTYNNITVLGTGRTGRRYYFDATLEGASQGGDVDTTNDVINYTNHGMQTGEFVLYDRNGNTGSYVTGAAGNGQSELLTGTTGEYYFIIRVSADEFALASSIANANAGTRLALSAVTNETHYVELAPDIRPDIKITGTTGSWSFTAGVLQGCRNITLQTNASLVSTPIVASHQLIKNGGTVTACPINAPTLSAGQSFMTGVSGSELADIDDNIFNSKTGDLRGGGHALEVDSATADATYSYSGNTHNNYASYSGTDYEFDGSSASVVDTTANTITISAHPYTDGEIVYYEDNGGGPIGGLTDGAMYYIGSITGASIALYHSRVDAINDANRISLTTVGTGTTHRFDSGNAAILNNTGVNWTLAIEGGGDSPSIRNIGATKVTVNNAVTVSLSGVTEGTPVKIVANETVGTITKGDVILEAFADSTGVAQTTTFNYESAFNPSGLDVVVRARNQGVAVAAIAEDNGTGFTNETENASDSTTNDMTLLPATPALNDAYYFGHNEQFSRLKLDISTVLTQSASPTFTWEYYNGSSWASLSGVTDGTSGFETSGENIVSWTIPGDWATTTVNSQGPLYYVRFRLSTVGTITQVPKGQKVTLDTTRYLPYYAERVITSSGLSDNASWNQDTVSKFTQ